MKTLYSIICLGIFMTPLSAGSPIWLSKTDFPGTKRNAAVAFSIGNIGYIGTGQDASGPRSDFWAFNTTLETWSQAGNIPNFGGGNKKDNIAFVVGGKGYVGMGDNMTNVYEYNPGMNMWTSKASITMGASGNLGVAFAIGSTAYFRSGNENQMEAATSFWAYDVTNNTWSQPPDLTETVNMVTKGVVRRSPAAFAVNGKGYIALGLDAVNVNHLDVYQFDPTGNVWTKKANFPGSIRFACVSISTGTKAYVGLGAHATDDFWEYDSNTDGWTQISNYPGIGGGRLQAVGFAVGDNLYVGTGSLSSDFFNDFYEYYPSGAPVLPVELTQINATADAQKEYVDVHWETATELQSAYFAIERQSKTSHQFEEIGRVKGAGNSAKTLAYDFIDEKPVYGISYYRLRLADIDGKTNYSKTVSVSYKGGAKIKVFPTFTEGYVTIENGDKRIDDVYVWNASGQLMLQSKQTQIDLSAFPRGLYLVQVKTGGEMFVQKITKQ